MMVNLPRPLPEAALKNFTAVGAVGLPAGTPTGYPILLFGLVQCPPPLIHTNVGAVLMLEAVVDNWLLELAVPVNVVDVIVRFQPAALPLGSLTVSPSA